VGVLADGAVRTREQKAKTRNCCKQGCKAEDLSVQGRFLSVSLIRVSRGRLTGDAATSLDTQNLSDGGNKIVWRFEELRGWPERLAMIGRQIFMTASIEFGGFSKKRSCRKSFLRAYFRI
jgi:hypothetical protein